MNTDDKEDPDRKFKVTRTIQYSCGHAVTDEYHVDELQYVLVHSGQRITSSDLCPMCKAKEQSHE